MADPRVLDVRTIPPVTRHGLIFSTLAELPAGAALELVNDHDPKPLYYQLQAEQTGRFTWEYLESGPTVWRVRIGRVGGEAESEVTAGATGAGAGTKA